MKTMVVVLFLTSSLVAGPRPDDLRIAAMHELAAARGARTTRAVTQATLKTGPEQWIFIPAAGSLQGNFGAFYKSDLMLANYRNVPQRVRLRWIPAQASGFGTTTQSVTIPANTAIAYDDVVSSLLHYSGLGSIEIVSRTSNDAIDLNGQIDAFSRIWTPQPGTTLGTVSQNFGGMGIFHTEGTAPAFALGLQQDAKYRTNVGIVNIDFFNAHTWAVQVIGIGGSTSFNITVPAFSMVQTSIPSGNFGKLYIMFTPDSSMTGEDWSAYASTSDNGTSDGWVSSATQLQ
ncbi:MAG TPA: hypothetical protein VJ032_01915 [Thermoanaerobaculia bacterium]|nr:hypothetical protein [Thermoanaerobaculia bacterium]